MCSEKETASQGTNKKVLTKRKRKNALPDISTNIQILYELAQKNLNLSITSGRKGNRGLHKGLSKRRSKCIGVSKNPHTWQALINVGKKKKYIGTYNSEKEAAIAYDFFWLGLNGSEAVTNYSYDSELLIDMISDYRSNPYIQPIRYADRVQVPSYLLGN